MCFISHLLWVQWTNHSPANKRQLVKLMWLSCASKPSERKEEKTANVLWSQQRAYPFLLFTQAFLLDQKSIFFRQRLHAYEDSHCWEVNKPPSERSLPPTKVPNPTFAHHVWNSSAIKRHLWDTPWATQSCFIHLSNYKRKSYLLFQFCYNIQDASQSAQTLYMYCFLVWFFFFNSKVQVGIFLVDRGRGFPKYFLN